MGNIHTVNCVLTSEVMNNKVHDLMKRTCQRMSFRCDKLTTAPPIPKVHVPSQKRVTLKHMPRCSSFDDLSALLPSSKKSDSDPTYLLWKKSFENPRQKPATVKQIHSARMRKRVHDMSSAISGHLTPKGFPSHTHTKKTHWRKTQNCKIQPNLEQKLLRLPLLDDSPRCERKIPVMSSDGNSQHHHHHHHYHSNKIQQQLLLLPSHIKITSKTPNLTQTTHITQSKYTEAPLNLLSKFPESKQAIIIEKLYRDIKHLKSCYDTKIDSFLL